MAGCCAGQCGGGNGDPRYRRILQVAFAINAAMFLVEVAAGLFASSAALQADALDFLSDAANFGISLFVLGMTLRHRAAAALVKGLCMAAFGTWVLGSTAWHAWFGTLPKAEIMGAVGLVALAANGIIAAFMFAYRRGDANMRSAWICARNDAIGNVAVVLAATGVFATRTNWPDIAVAALIGSLNLFGAVTVILHALRDRRAPAAVTLNPVQA